MKGKKPNARTSTLLRISIGRWTEGRIFEMIILGMFDSKSGRKKMKLIKIQSWIINKMKTVIYNWGNILPQIAKVMEHTDAVENEQAIV